MKERKLAGRCWLFFHKWTKWIEWEGVDWKLKGLVVARQEWEIRRCIRCGLTQTRKFFDSQDF